MNDIYFPTACGRLKLGPMLYEDEINTNCQTGEYWHAVGYDRTHKLYQYLVTQDLKNCVSMKVIQPTIVGARQIPPCVWSTPI